MKAFKLILIFSVLIFAITGALLVLNLASVDEAILFAGKAIALVIFAGVPMYLIWEVANSKKKKSQSETSSKPGPKF